MLSWSKPPDCPSLPEGVIQLWWLPWSEALAARADWLRARLSPAERTSFPHLPPRAALLKASAWCLRRALLARFLALPPEAVALDLGGPHKPRLRIPADLEFSCSYATDGLLLGFARAVAIGVDVERVELGADESAGMVLTPAEQAWLRQQADRPRAFATLWTRKEAVLKATGDGLVLEPSAFEVLSDEIVTPAKGSETPPEVERGLMRAGVAVQVIDLAPTPDHVAGLAYLRVSSPPGLQAYRLDRETVLVSLLE